MGSILVIDDSEELRMAYTMLLRMEGYDVVCACDGEEGLRMVRHEQPDLVIVDMRMPVMDGLTFLEQLRHERLEQLPPVIANSGADGQRAAALIRGAVAFLEKPVQSHELIAAVEVALAAAARRRNRSYQSARLQRTG
jgi:CheY-like chemotaxis protein